MLDSPTKQSKKDVGDRSQVLWRGSQWLLLKPGEELQTLSRAQIIPNKSNLDDLATDLKNDASLRKELKKTLRALDKNPGNTNTEGDEANSTEGDILEIILYVVDLVKNGQLLWLPRDAIERDANENDRTDRGATDAKTATNSDSKSPESPPKSKPKRILKRKTKISDDSGPQTPSQLLKSVAGNDQVSHDPAEKDTAVPTAKKEAPPAKTPRKTRISDGDATRGVAQTHNVSLGAKSLIELFTNADATIGEPVSRWLGFTGVIPGDGSAVVGDTVLAQAAHKLAKKPGKLGNGKVSPKNADLRSHGSPINVISGEIVLEQTDFELPGPIPLRWQRIYRNSHSKDLGLGVGWTSLLLSRLDLRENEIIYCSGEGREIPFDRLPSGKSCCNCVEQLTLYCDDTTVYRIIDANHTILTFGGSGKRRRLYEITNPDGHAIKLFYSANDRLIQILDSTGRRLKLDYNIADQLRRIHLCNDNGDIKGEPLVEYNYNNDRDLVKVVDAMGYGEKFEYRYHLITKHTTKEGYNVHFEWDEYTIKGKCSRTWGDGNIDSYLFKYDEANKITRCTDSRSNTREYHYNELGLITTEIDPEGGVSQYTYNVNGRVLSKRTPGGTTANYNYDSHDRLIRHVNADGGISLFEYNKAGNLVKFIDPLDQSWEREYDQSGRIISLKDPDGQLTHINYSDPKDAKNSSENFQCTITGPSGHTQQFEWNNKGELLIYTDSMGKKSRFSYDDVGRVTKLSEADDKVTHISYDRRNNITQIIHPNGASVQMLYSPAGNLTQYVDAIGRTTRYKYDGLGQVIERCDPDGKRVFYEYDKQRNLVCVVNENGERHQLQYDRNGLVIQEIGFDGRIQKYNYDATGHLVRHLDGANRVTSFKRDALGRVLQKRTSTGEITQFEYDALGQLVKGYNSHSVIHCRYNNQGRPIGEMQNNNTIKYRYDASGNKTQVVLPNGKTIRYNYDKSGLLSQILHDGNLLCTLEYDHHGREIRRTSGEVCSQFEYDPMGRLILQRVTKNKECIWEQRYRYDKTGNLRQIDELDNGKIKFHYDALDRLKKSEGTVAEAFTFDPTGNLLDNQYPEPLGFVQGNRLRVFQNYRFEYDDVGNMVRQFQGRLETRFYYNVANQMVRTFKNGQTIEYTYDPLGRRCKKSDAASEIDYLWDGDTLIHEHRNKNQSNSLSITYIHEPNGVRPICQIRDDDTYFYHTDHAGTPRLITDVNGNIAWRADYKSHGGVNRLKSQAIDNPIRFPGQYHDPETGLHYSRFRYYHPVIGRYINQHPFGLKGGVNPYEYAPNPLGWINPLGLQCEEIFATQAAQKAKATLFKVPSVAFILPGPSTASIQDDASATDYPGKFVAGKC